MSIGIGIIVFFIALIALVAEFILYFIFGLGTSFSGDLSPIGGMALFFFSLMILTATAGILFLICSIFATITKNKKVWGRVFIVLFGIVLLSFFIFVPIITKTTTSFTRAYFRKKAEEKQSYISKVKLYSFEAKYYSTYLDGRVPGVEFKLKNEGDRTLTEVEVTVYFKDASGNVIAEEDYHPVLVSEYSFTNGKPLKPNYIWQLEAGKFYQAKSVPSEWQEGNAVAKITNIEFQE